MAVCLLGLVSFCCIVCPRLDVVVLLYLIIFYVVMVGYYLLEAYSFLKRDMKGVDLDGREDEEEQEGVEGGKQTSGYEKNNLFSIKKESFFLQWVMINIYSELVKILRINDYGCSALNEMSLSTYPRLRRYLEREKKECKSWVRKECCEKLSSTLDTAAIPMNSQIQLLAAKDLPTILRTFYLKRDIES